MDSILNEASKCSKLMQFASLGSEPATYKAVSIASFSNKASCENRNLDAQSLLRFATAEPSAGSECFFRLVCFTFDYKKVLQSSRDVFDQVYTSFKLPESAKYLLYHRATGIHTFNRHDDHLSFYLSLAKKASDDSSSMRIVAIMTMTFLPGTFFAALFAVPSLDWKDGDIVTGKFWVYWAFTIPSTVAVFMLWFVLTKRNSYK